MAIDNNDILFEAVVSHQLQLLRVDAQMRKEVLREIKKIEKELVSLIVDNDTWTQRRLRKLLSEARGLIKVGYDVIDEKTFEDLVELGVIESDYMSKTFTSVGITTETLPVKKIESILRKTLIDGAPSSTWWGRQSETLMQNFEDQVRTGVLLGENNAKIIRRVRGTRDFGYTNGIMNTSRREAESLVRTSVQSASNQVRFETMESVQNLIKSYKHIATLDSRTTDICIVRDGKRWKADTKEPIGHSLPFQVPPLHWGCRSAIIAELKGVDLPDDVTRASPDGQVPANVSFEEYLKKKGDSFADETLGKGKAKLWREGKITLRQLLDQSGNPLTLKQLKAKYDN